MPDVICVLAHLSWGTSSEFEILHGIRDFMRLRPNWTLRAERNPSSRSNAEVDARILTSGFAGRRRKLAGSTAPVVSLVDDRQADMRINVADAEIGRIAARHLLERGYRQLVFASDGKDAGTTSYRGKRHRGFAEIAAESGASLTIVENISRDWNPRGTPPSWLAALPRPCGVFSPDDHSALIMLECCRFARIAVPEEVAVIGADNATLWCETALPPLSSVVIPWRKVGYEAATWVERLLDGQPPLPDRLVEIPPEGVMTRQSTDGVAQTHPVMVRALEHIRANCFSGMTVKSLELAVGINRRRLDRLFLRHLGRSPYQEMYRLRIAKAKELLACTDLSLRQICSATGMSYEYFTANFLEATGLSALAYRQTHRR